MDALMIVHQLQRLAAEPRPSPAVRAKIPRMAVGICYFLEHPDPGVQHQAAGALRLMLHQHTAQLLQAQELPELRAALQQHAKSADVVVSECCSASLALLQQQEQQQKPEQKHQTQNSADAATADEAATEALESLDLFSVVLGLRGLLRCPSNRSLLNFKQQQQDQQQRQRMLELLQRDLQLRLVRVWGVSSATVTLNTASLLQQAEAQEAGKAAATNEQQNEEGDGVAVVSIRLSRRAQRLQQQLRELRAAVGPLTLLLNSELVQKAPQHKSKAKEASEYPGEASSDFQVDGNRSNGSEQAAPQQQQESGYLDEDLKGTWDGTGEGDSEGAGAAKLGANGGFSFFSANSALFAQSRFMGGMITPTETSSDLSAKLKAEKERKAALRAQNQGGLIDRLMGRLGSGAGLL